MSKICDIHVLVIPSFYSTQEEPVKGTFFKEQSECIKNNVGVKIGIVYPELRSIKNLSISGIIKNHFQTKLYDESGINVYRKHRWNLIPTRYRIGKILWVKSVLKLADKYITKFGKPSLIHAHCALWGGYAAKIISDKYNIPYIVTEHSTVYARSMLKKKEIDIVCDVFNSAKKVLVVSNPFKILLHEYLNIDLDKMIVVPNFIDTNYFIPPKVEIKDNSMFTFLSIAFLNEKKGMDKLLKAFANEFKGRKNVRLRIGGDGPDRRKLEEMARKLKIESQVDFLGLLSREQVKENMWFSKCFVLASNIETFGVVFIEAMSTGLPIIATRSGGPEDIVRPNVGYLVDSEGIGELSLALRNMYKEYNKFNPDEIREYVKKNFSNNVICNRILQIYTDALL